MAGEVRRSAAELAPYWEDALHSLKGEPHVIDTRNIGLMGAVELSSRPGKAGERAYDAMIAAFEKGAMLRITGDTIAMSPPLIVQKSEIDQAIDVLRATLRELS